MNPTINKTLREFSDLEIRDEYTARFGDPDSISMSDFDNAEVREEYFERFGVPDPEPPSRLDEIADLIAEAARISPYAKKAYQLLRDEYERALPPLESRQRLIENRMKGAA